MSYFLLFYSRTWTRSRLFSCSLTLPCRSLNKNFNFFLEKAIVVIQLKFNQDTFWYLLLLLLSILNK